MRKIELENVLRTVDISCRVLSNIECHTDESRDTSSIVALDREDRLESEAGSQRLEAQEEASKATESAQNQDSRSECCHQEETHDTHGEKINKNIVLSLEAEKIPQTSRQSIEEKARYEAWKYRPNWELVAQARNHWKAELKRETAQAKTRAFKTSSGVYCQRVKTLEGNVQGSHSAPNLHAAG